MAKKKKKSTRKSKKKVMRPAKRTHGKKPARKKKSVKSKSRSADVLAVEVSEVEVFGDVENESGGETETDDSLDEHFPPEYGGSE